MNRRFLTTALLGFITIIILNWSCTKLDTTNLGGDLLPVVDNVNTFADTMDIDVFQEDFLPSDTTSLSRSEDHVLGRIDNDPIFGATTAQVFVQFKPGSYPFYFGASKDTLFGPGLGFDSVVLCLSYKGAWGDTSAVQNLRVLDIPSSTGGEWDSLYKVHRITYAPATGFQIGTGAYDIHHSGDLIKFAHGKDSVTAQIRIKLDSTWGAKIFYQDSASSTRPGFGFYNNAFYKDSIFRANFKGLSIESTAGRALMYTNLGDGTSRLEFHYRKRKDNIVDTTYSSLRLETGGSGPLPSATANKIVRTRSIPGAGDAVKDNDIYLQTTPGTYARLKIDRLNTFRDTNRIIHRAQISIFQIPGGSDDNKFTAPNFLYLDLRDTSSLVKHKPVYLDLNPSEYYNPDRPYSSLYEAFYPSAVEYGYYGGFLKTRIDPVSGLSQTYYDFNVSRYIQKMVTSTAPNKVPNYELRLFAPYSFSYPQISESVIAYPNSLAMGRVKVGGSLGAGSYKMKMVIIWSKVKTL